MKDYDKAPVRQSHLLNAAQSDFQTRQLPAQRGSAARPSKAAVCPVGGWKRHPFAEVMAPSEDKCRPSLVAGIRRDGLDRRIYIYEGQLLDGWTCLKACEEAGVEPTFVEYEGDEPLRFVLSRNLVREHRPTGVRAAIVAYLQDWNHAIPHGGARQQAATLQLVSVKDRAALAACSVRTQASADRVSKASREVLQRVIKGTMSLEEAEKMLFPKVLAEKQERDPHRKCKERIEELEARLQQRGQEARSSNG